MFESARMILNKYKMFDHKSFKFQAPRCKANISNNNFAFPYCIIKITKKETSHDQFCNFLTVLCG
jgi:hypothetical protein